MLYIQLFFPGWPATHFKGCGNNDRTRTALITQNQRKVRNHDGDQLYEAITYAHFGSGELFEACHQPHLVNVHVMIRLVAILYGIIVGMYQEQDEVQHLSHIWVSSIRLSMFSSVFKL